MNTLDTGSLISHVLDQFPLGLLFLVTVLLLLVLIEIGYRLGKRAQKHQSKAQHSQVRAIMGATLGLLAFMLAFTFAMAQSHYELRVSNMVEEARLASNAFMLAETLDEPLRLRARQTLHEYITDRIRFKQMATEGGAIDLRGAIRKSEALQGELWSVALENQRKNRGPDEHKTEIDAFMSVVISLIDIQAMRLQAALMNRISWVIWATLYLMAFLSMLVMGYQAGLVTKRSPIATVTLGIAFAAVMALITDLDRPVMSMFQVNDQIMVNLAERMATML